VVLSELALFEMLVKTIIPMSARYPYFVMQNRSDEVWVVAGFAHRGCEVPGDIHERGFAQRIEQRNIFPRRDVNRSFGS
jgi:hypothetical protein